MSIIGYGRSVIVPTPGVRVIQGRAPTAADWWDPNNEGLCVWAAYQPKGAANFAASILDLTGNGNHAVDPGGANTPGWNAVNGWTFDGVQQYLTTTFVPQNDQSQSALGQFTGAAAILATVCGCRGGGGGRQFLLAPTYNPILGIRYANGGNADVIPTLANGNIGVAGASGYRNGIAEGILGAWTDVAISAYIGCRNNIGVPDAWFDGEIHALAIYDCVLTAPQMLAVATAMALL